MKHLLSPTRIMLNGRGYDAWPDGTLLPVVGGGDGPVNEHLPQELRDRLAGLAEASDEDIAALEADLQEHLEGLPDGSDDREVTDDTLAEGRECVEAIRQTWTEAARREQEAADAAEAEEQRRQAMADLRAEVDPDAGDGEEGDGEQTEGEGGEGEGEQQEQAGAGEAEAEAEAEGQQAEPVAAGARAGSQRPRIGQVNARARMQRQREQQRQAQRTEVLRPRTTLVASAPWGDFQAGQRLESLEQVAMAFTAAAHSLRNARGNDGQQVPVVRLSVEYPDERHLTRGDIEGNSRKLDQLTRPQAIAAAGGLCAPLMPDYTVPQISDASRRLPGALARMGAERGGIRWVPAPVFGDYSTGVDDWTAANDATPSDPTTKPCATVDCDSEATATVDAITKCLQVGNFIARTYDERVQAIIELLDAFWARHAEAKHLTTIGSGSTNLTTGQGLGATRDILAHLDLAVAAERDRFRMSDSEPLRFMTHRLVRSMIRADLAREIPGSTDERLAVADATIDSFFAARDVNVTWLMDTESGAAFGAQAAGALVGWPSSIVGYLFHEGAWVFLDGGTLDLGVVRDSTLNETNDFQIFAESFEQVAKKGIWSRRLSFDVCPSGWTSAPVDFDPCATGS